MRKAYIVAAVIAALLFAVIGAAGTSGPTDLTGKAVQLFDANHAKLTVLIFVRTDCPISNRYAPMIQQLGTDRVDRATFFLVYPSRKETAEAIRRHLKEFGYTLAAIRDPQHILVKQSAAQITPEAAVFNAKGQLVYHGRIDNLYEDFGHTRKQATTHELPMPSKRRPRGRV